MKKLILAAAALMFVAACEDTPPPAATAAPAAAVKQYMVFFDFDRSNITAQAAATIKQAADAAKAGMGSSAPAMPDRQTSAAADTARAGVIPRLGNSNACAADARRRGLEGEDLKKFVDQCMSVGVTRIAVTGHTDTSGSPAYNMALSLRRANAVKDALVREGVPAAAIAVTGRGETQLLVQTGDNVKEPQNRRVEIVLQ